MLAGLAVALSIPASSTGSPDRPPAPDYSPRADGPLEVAGVPVALDTARNGHDASDLEVLTRASGLERFSNLRYGHLKLTDTVALPGISTTLSSADWIKETPYRVISQSDIGSIAVVKIPEDPGEPEVTEVPVGGRPSSATKISMIFGLAFFDRMSTGEPWFAVTDRDADTLSIYDPESATPGRPRWSIGVGREPVAAASVSDLDWFVVNRGSDDVTLARLVVGDRDPDGRFEAIKTIPVGDSPVAVTTVATGSDGELVAVVNRGSDSVSIIRRTDVGGSVDAHVIQTIGVGDRPASITALDANGDGSGDLAVADSGSDDIRILVGDGSGHFLHGRRIKVGDRPVAIAPMRLNRYFSNDLAVANAGDRNISLLLRSDGPARCHDRPAHPVEGTRGPDRLPGTRDPDLIEGYGGGDEIRSGRGYDCLDGGAGGDLIRAGSSNDRVRGGNGDDRLTAAAGDDLIRGGRGDDRICDSNKRFSRCFSVRTRTYRPGASDRDRVFGGRGDDRITAGPQRDVISGGRGDDLIDSRDGDIDKVRCGPGSDVARTDIRDRTAGCEVVRKRRPNGR